MENHVNILGFAEIKQSERRIKKDPTEPLCPRPRQETEVKRTSTESELCVLGDEEGVLWATPWQHPVGDQQPSACWGVQEGATSDSSRNLQTKESAGAQLWW